MTRKEAIKVLEMFLHKQCDLKRTEFAYDANTVWGAVKMASEALEQEPIYYPPCQDCHTKVNEIVRAYNNVKSLDDAISRQEAIHCVTETELYNETFAEAKMRIAELKPVLPKREREDKK